jgi:type I restriction enzyme S subunit
VKSISLTLGEICKVDWGNTKLTKSSYISGGEFLAVSAAGPDGRISHYEHEGNVPVLSAIGAQCGKMFYPTEKFTAIKNTITLTPKKDFVDGKFLYYLFTYVELPQRGAGQPFISKGDIQSFKITIPKEIKNQRLIVDQIDKAFAEVDLLEKNLQLKKEKTNQLLQSMLNDAFTKNQNIDIKVVKLGDVCVFSRGLTYKKSDEVENSINVVLRANNIDLESNSLKLDDLKYIKDSIKISPEKIVKKNSIIICTASGSKTHLGKVAIITQDFGYAYGGFMGQITPTEQCHYKYLFYIFISPKFKNYLMRSTDGTNINNLKFSDIVNFEFQLPSLNNQTLIVEKLDKAFAEIEFLKSQLALEKQMAAALRQSILSDAFNFADEAA